MGNWKTVPLDDLVTIKGGGTPSTDVAAYWQGDIPWVSPKDMKVDEIAFSQDTISHLAIENSATNMIPEGSVLVVTRSGILARTIPVGLTVRELTVNQDIKALCPKAGIDSRFLFYFLRSSEPDLLRRVSRGATVHRLSTDDIRSLPFPVVSLPEQKRIVAILDEAFEGIDKAIANTEKNLANARELFASGLRAEFSRTDDTWRELLLGEQVRFIDYRGKTPPKTPEGIRLITAKNVKMGYINRDPEEFMERSAYADWMTRGFPKRGDVLFTTEAPLGNIAQLDTDEQVVIGQRLITMQPDPNVLTNEFLKFRLMSPQTQELIWSHATGATVQGIKAKLLKLIPIPTPSLEVQRRIAKKLDRLVEWTDQVEEQQLAKLAALTQLKASLLTQAFSGKLSSSALFTEAAQ